MGKLGYHTSFLKNLLLRIERAAKGAVRFTEDRYSARLEALIMFSFDFSRFSVSASPSDILRPIDGKRQWIRIAESDASSRNRRYRSILDYLIKQSSDKQSFQLNVLTALGFEFSSIEELDMKLTIAGY